MTSDARGEGGSAKSDFISKGSLIKHMMRGGGGVKKGQKSSDVIYGRSLNYLPHLVCCWPLCEEKNTLLSGLDSEIIPYLL